MKYEPRPLKDVIFDINMMALGDSFGSDVCGDALFYLKQYRELLKQQGKNAIPEAVFDEVDKEKKEHNTIDQIICDFECNSKYDKTGDWVLMKANIFQQTLDYLREIRSNELLTFDEAVDEKSKTGVIITGCGQNVGKTWAEYNHQMSQKTLEAYLQDSLEKHPSITWDEIFKMLSNPIMIELTYSDGRTWTITSK